MCPILLSPKESFLPTITKYNYYETQHHFYWWLSPRITAAQLLYSLCCCTSFCLTLANDLPGNCSYQRKPIWGSNWHGQGKLITLTLSPVGMQLDKMQRYIKNNYVIVRVFRICPSKPICWHASTICNVPGNQKGKRQKSKCFLALRVLSTWFWSMLLHNWKEREEYRIPSPWGKTIKSQHDSK